MQERIIEILNSTPMKNRKTRWSQRFEGDEWGIWEFNKELYPCPESKHYGIPSGGDGFDKYDRVTDYTSRLLNRQAGLLHLLGRHAETDKYDQRADALFDDLRHHRAKIYNEANIPEDKYKDQSPDDWLPVEKGP